MAKKDIQYDNLASGMDNLNAALDIFNTNEESAEEAQGKKAKNKTKRFNLMFQPAVYEQLKEIANVKGMSVASLINSICADYIREYNAK